MWSCNQETWDGCRPGEAGQTYLNHAPWLVERTGLSPATVNKALAQLEKLGIVRELTAQKRNRLFSYGEYVEIVSRGTELPLR